MITNEITGEIPDLIDFNFHVKPILADRCFACHGPDENAREGNFRLDLEKGAFAPLDSMNSRFAIIPGDPSKSELIQRIRSDDFNDLMPPPDSKLELSEREKTILEKWISQGAIWKKHWSFIPPEPQEIPEVKKEDWPNNDIDYFILAKLENIGLNPNERAEKHFLLRRLSYDLTGLPPTIEMQDRFVNDETDGAYEKIVDELLASEHFGERMALHWLDVARYADSHGYQDDGYRTMWPWRDWVIHAFNENYSYDKFITWQLAGDLIPQANKEMILATGFNRNHKITQEGGVIDEEYRIEYVTDRTNTFSKSFLGLTMECAKCHDHKYDPISQKDYYQTFSFFDQVPEKGIFATIGAHSFADPPSMEITNEDISDVLSFVNKKDTNLLEVMIMKDSSQMRMTQVLHRGNYNAPTDTVLPSTPPAILPFDSAKYSADRLGLAKWLLDDENPLTSRVFVNRIWQDFFGRGLVRTSGDFGLQGDLPSHPKLLDHLAYDFRTNGWNIKGLIKKLVMSATYQQSSKISQAQLKKDPENVYLARAPRYRLVAEAVRDHVLASSGLLNSEIGGPSVKPYQAGDIWSIASPGRGLLMNYVQDHGSKLYRRGMYVFIKRTMPPPTMLMFDASNRDQCEVRRPLTNTPLQALAMLNDPHVLEGARVLAQQLIQEESPIEAKIKKAFQSIICRPASDRELTLLQDHYREEYSLFGENLDRASSFLKVGEAPMLVWTDQSALASLMQVVHTIYNMEEAITRS